MDEDTYLYVRHGTANQSITSTSINAYPLPSYSTSTDELLENGAPAMHIGIAVESIELASEITNDPSITSIHIEHDFLADYEMASPDTISAVIPKTSPTLTLDFARTFDVDPHRAPR